RDTTRSSPPCRTPPRRCEPKPGENTHQRRAPRLRRGVRSVWGLGGARSPRRRRTNMAETFTNGHTQSYVGTRTIRPDGVDKVTGRARFGADFNLPGQLIGRVLRSPHPHARIVAIDTSKAEALPGVKAVITRDDFADQPSEFIPAGEMMMNYKD